MSERTFAERVAALEGNLPDMLSVEDDQTVHDLILCIREQQAALRATLPHIYHGNNGEGRRAENEARSILSRYELKEPK